MKHSWRPYIEVYQQQFLLSLAKLMTFRLNFLLTVLVDIVMFLTFYCTTDVLFLHVSHIGEWRREHFMFFVFWMQSLNCIHGGLVAPNFWNLATEVRNGALDFRLLRPLGSLFDVFTAINRPISLLILPLTVAGVVYYGMELQFSSLCWLVMPLLWIISLSLLVLLEVLISMGLFWTRGGDGINFIRIHCQQFQRWPDFVYPDGIRFVFTRIFPLLAAGVFPVRALFGEGAWWEIPFLLVSIVLAWRAIGFLWMRGLRRYESISS